MLRQPNGPASPFTFGSRFSSPTTQFSSTISPVIDARSESLPSIFGVENPFAPRSTTKPRMTPSSFAHTTAMSAIGALVIHILAPVSRNPPWTFSARVTIEPGSEPWSGSVSPKQPTISPLASLGRYLRRCASDPYLKTGCITRDDCTDMAERKPESTRSEEHTSELQ